MGDAPTATDADSLLATAVFHAETADFPELRRRPGRMFKRVLSRGGVTILACIVGKTPSDFDERGASATLSTQILDWRQRRFRPTERCRSGRSGLTRNQLCPLLGTGGSNPSLSAISF